MTQENNIKNAIELIRQGLEKLQESANPYDRIGSLTGVLAALVDELDIAIKDIIIWRHVTSNLKGKIQDPNTGEWVDMTGGKGEKRNDSKKKHSSNR